MSITSPPNLLVDPFAAHREMLARNWWIFALRGALGIMFGLIALFLPGVTMLSLVLVFSAYMLVDGICAIASGLRAARQGERWGWFIFEGIANLAAGIVAFLLPGLTVLVFVFLIAAWALLSGGLMLGAALRLDADHGRWWLVLGGLASVVYGALLVIAPMIGAVVLTWWIGAYAIVFGVALLLLSFRLKSRADTDMLQPNAAPRS
jgi:uncharacterized membrane protein HdeD (DUF308 family)